MNKQQLITWLKLNDNKSLLRTRQDMKAYLLHYQVKLLTAQETCIQARQCAYIRIHGNKCTIAATTKKKRSLKKTIKATEIVAVKFRQIWTKFMTPKEEEEEKKR